MSDLLYRVECHVREHRMHWYRRFREPKLFIYARNMRYEDIVKRCERHPRKAAKEAKFRHEYAPQQTPLHRVLEPMFLIGGVGAGGDTNWAEVHGTRHRAARCLLEANPSAALVPCSFGTTPLHIACMDPYGCVEDVEMLLKKCPKCGMAKDLQGRVALHYACINNRANALMIQTLLEHCREAADVQDKFGRLPLHYLALADPLFDGYQIMEDKLIGQSMKVAKCTTETMQMLLNATHDEDGANVLDNEKMIPLDYLCRHVDKHKQDDAGSIDAEFLSVFLLLAKAYDPLALNLKYGKEGRKPIDIIGDYRSKLLSTKGTLEEAEIELLGEICSHVS